MFWFMQEPSSGSSPVLSCNYKYGFTVLVGIDAVNVMAALKNFNTIAARCKHDDSCGFFQKASVLLETLSRDLGAIAPIISWGGGGLRSVVDAKGYGPIISSCVLAFVTK
jgi:hypothetical protein